MIDKYMHWTQQAIDCYNLGCMCSKCTINEVMNKGIHRCRMKSTVIRLVKLYGKPKPIEDKDSKFDIEQIKQWLKDGYSLKDIAEMYGVARPTLRIFTQAHGLTGTALSKIKKKKGKWTL